MGLTLLKSPAIWLLLMTAIASGGWIWEATTRAKAQAGAAILQSHLKAANDKAAAAQRREQAKEAAINTLTGELAAQAAATQQLQGQLDQLAATATTREQTIARLKRENAELKSWADRPLPAAVVGLLQRPALTSATDYQAHLSGAVRLPATASQPAQ